MRNKNTNYVLGITALLVVLGCSGAASADEVYFSFKGGQLGPVPAEVMTKGLEGKLRALGAGHEVAVPIDQATGQTTGQRMLKPFVLKRERGRASPRLLQALAQGETFAEVVVEYWTLLKTGVMSQHQAVILKNARVIRIEHTAEQIPGQPAGQLESTEIIHIAYNAMEYADNVLNTKAIVQPLAGY